MISKTILATVGMIFLTSSLFAQSTSNPETWRAKGYEARINNKPDSSLYYYSKVLEINPQDWDALLATARLYYQTWQLDEALDRYMQMLMLDSNDAHALNGLGITSLRMGEYDSALRYLNKALAISPDLIQALLGKAKILGDNGKMKEAIKLYNQALAYDSTIAEAWAGIATMHYWSNHPNSALPMYEKALALDPTNEEYRASVNQMKRIVAYYIGLSYLNIIETEFWEGRQVYDINANVGNLFLAKRVSDHFAFRAGAMMDFSKKDIVDSNTVLRRFDNYYFNPQFFYRDHSLTFHLGYSFSDQVASTYGLSLNNQWRIKKLRINNTIGLNHEYFYYWNRVSRDYVSDKLILTLKRWRFENSLMTGSVRKAFVFDSERNVFESENPFTIVRSSLTYNFIEKPQIGVVIMHEWRDFEYKSPLYWSPFKRSLVSPGIKFSHEWKDWYAYAYLNVGMANSLAPDASEVDLNVGNIDGAAEIGYAFGNWLVALGYSAYSNKYYKNSVVNALVRLRI